MIAIKRYLVSKEMFPNKPSKDAESTGYHLLKDVGRMRDNIPQDTSSDFTFFYVLGSPSHIYQNEENWSHLGIYEPRFSYLAPSIVVSQELTGCELQDLEQGQLAGSSQDKISWKHMLFGKVCCCHCCYAWFCFELWAQMLKKIWLHSPKLYWPLSGL